MDAFDWMPRVLGVPWGDLWAASNTRCSAEEVAVAVHEAGHAIAALDLGYSVTSVKMEREDWHTGWMSRSWIGKSTYDTRVDALGEFTAEDWMSDAVICLAAYEAFRLLHPSVLCLSGWTPDNVYGSDLTQIHEAFRALGVKESGKVEGMARSLAAESLRANSVELDLLAANLLRYRSLTFGDVEVIVTREANAIRELQALPGKPAPRSSPMHRQSNRESVPARRRKSPAAVPWQRTSDPVVVDTRD